MTTKTLIWIGMFLGSTIGSYIPVMFGADLLSSGPIWGSCIGAILGVWGGYKLGEHLGL